MAGQGRLGDKANVPIDTHGCIACPHPGVGPAIQGSPDVNVNRRPALRVGDAGLHAACCGANTWSATAGSATVLINGKAAHRMGDQTRHCGGPGTLIEGSPNVIVGETSAAGSGSARPAASSAASSGGGGAAAATGNSTGGGAGAAGAASAAGAATAAGAAAASEPAPPATWLEIELLGEDGRGVADERYVVLLPDGVRQVGALDATGKARIAVAAPGTCDVSFPDLDSEAWEPVDA